MTNNDAPGERPPDEPVRRSGWLERRLPYILAFIAAMSAVGPIWVAKISGDVDQSISEARIDLDESISDARIDLDKSISEARIEVDKSISRSQLEVTAAISRSQLEAEYVGIAVDILAAEKPMTDDRAAIDADQALREWAVQVLQVNSPVPLSDKLVKALSQGDVTLSANLTNLFFPSLFDFSTFPMDGPLPEGCVITTGGDKTIHSEPSLLSFEVGRLPPGDYPVTEVVTPPLDPLRGVPLARFFKVEEGWIVHAPYVDTLSSECFA